MLKSLTILSSRIAKIRRIGLLLTLVAFAVLLASAPWRLSNIGAGFIGMCIAFLCLALMLHLIFLGRRLGKNHAFCHTSASFLSLIAMVLGVGWIGDFITLPLLILICGAVMFSGTMSRTWSNAATAFGFAGLLYAMGLLGGAIIGGFDFAADIGNSFVVDLVLFAMLAVATLLCSLDRSILRHALYESNFGKISASLFLVSAGSTTFAPLMAVGLVNFNLVFPLWAFLIPTIAIPWLLAMATAVVIGQSVMRVTTRTRRFNAMTRSYSGLEEDVEERTNILVQMNEELIVARSDAMAKARHMKDVLDSMQAFVGVLNPDGILLDVNKSALEVVGAKEVDVIGKSFEDTPWWNFSEESRARIRAIIQQCATGKRVKVELPYADKYRSLRSVDFVMSPLYSESCEVEFLVPSGVDIQERKVFEDELIKARIEAEISNQAKSSFLAHMSHELRSPIGVILGFIDLALQEKKSDQRVSHLMTIQRNAIQLLALVDEILDLRKIESGQVSVDIEDINLSHVLDDVMTSLQIKAKERGLALTLDLDASVPQEIRTDPLRLKQILLNVVGNAIKYTEKGFVRCKVDVTPASVGGGNLLRFTITDSGIGIAASDRAVIFEPFCRGRLGQQKRFAGTGLGLVLSRRLARLLGGDVELVRSEPGVGSIFRVTVAAHRKIDEDLAALSSVASTDATAVADRVRPGRLAGIRILVVDDVADNRILISRYLDAEGAVVSTATGGSEALAMCANDGFQVVLMDLSMPDLSGQETTAELRKRGYGVPIVALTAHAMREEKEQALKHGFNEYLTKPLTREALVGALVRILKIDSVGATSGF